MAAIAAPSAGSAAPAVAPPPGPTLVVLCGSYETWNDALKQFQASLVTINTMRLFANERTWPALWRMVTWFRKVVQGEASAAVAADGAGEARYLALNSDQQHRIDMTALDCVTFGTDTAGKPSRDAFHLLYGAEATLHHNGIDLAACHLRWLAHLSLVELRREIDHLGRDIQRLLRTSSSGLAAKFLPQERLVEDVQRSALTDDALVTEAAFQKQQHLVEQRFRHIYHYRTVHAVVRHIQKKQDQAAAEALGARSTPSVVKQRRDTVAMLLCDLFVSCTDLKSLSDACHRQIIDRARKHRSTRPTPSAAPALQKPPVRPLQPLVEGEEEHEAEEAVASSGDAAPTYVASSSSSSDDEPGPEVERPLTYATKRFKPGHLYDDDNDN
jgi:hypothetical protein